MRIIIMTMMKIYLLIVVVVVVVVFVVIDEMMSCIEGDVVLVLRSDFGASIDVVVVAAGRH